MYFRQILPFCERVIGRKSLTDEAVPTAGYRIHKTPKRFRQKGIERRENKKNGLLKVTVGLTTCHKHFSIMLYVHTIGRIGQDCKVIDGTHGSFISFDVAVDNYAHGNNVTTWVRVRSKKENHIRLSEYLTKGRLLLIEGTLSASKIGRASCRERV